MTQNELISSERRKLTPEEIQSARTSNGTIPRGTQRSWGITAWPVKPGWMQALMSGDDPNNPTAQNVRDAKSHARAQRLEAAQASGVRNKKDHSATRRAKLSANIETEYRGRENELLSLMQAKSRILKVKDGFFITMLQKKWIKTVDLPDGLYISIGEALRARAENEARLAVNKSPADSASDEL